MINLNPGSREAVLVKEVMKLAERFVVAIEQLAKVSVLKEGCVDTAKLPTTKPVIRHCKTCKYDTNDSAYCTCEDTCENYSQWKSK